MNYGAGIALCGAVLFFCSFGPYFVEPVVAGIDPVTLEPFVANLDLIGCPMIANDFAVSGTCTEQMYGMCESVWVPDMVSYHSHLCDLYFIIVMFFEQRMCVIHLFC